jgi:glycerol-3-phosphate dehydrogenase (NAD(P)+)
MRSAITTAAPLLKPGCPLVSFAKGIDAESEKTMPELFAGLAPQHPLAAVGGPMLAEEISAGGNAAAVIASKDESFRAALHELFSSPQFRAEPSADPGSVAWAGVLKNIYAFALGIADGLKVSDNEKGWFAAKAIDEMAGLAATLNIDPAIVLGTAGVGDLIATGYSQHSRNRQAGDEIVATGTCKVPGEGLMSLPAFIKRLGPDTAIKFPLLTAVKKITLDHEPAKTTIDAYFEGE